MPFWPFKVLADLRENWMESCWRRDWMKTSLKRLKKCSHPKISSLWATMRIRDTEQAWEQVRSEGLDTRNTGLSGQITSCSGVRRGMALLGPTASQDNKFRTCNKHFWVRGQLRGKICLGADLAGPPEARALEICRGEVKAKWIWSTIIWIFHGAQSQTKVPLQALTAPKTPSTSGQLRCQSLLTAFCSKNSRIWWLLQIQTTGTRGAKLLTRCKLLPKITAKQFELPKLRPLSTWLTSIAKWCKIRTPKSKPRPKIQ